MENEKVYYSDKQEARISIVEAVFITMIICLLSFAMSNKRDIGDLDISTYVFLCIGTIIVFFVILSSRTNLINYKIMIHKQYIKSVNIISVFDKVVEWKNVDIVILGEVENKDSRFNSYFYGVEFRYKNEYGSKESKSFKLSHMVNHEGLMEDIIKICKSYEIDFKDLRE
ncbi:hypothetical protein [Crassaminicella profunda]|uniref:hypothetical protein n=1 Tax=Crassaminicella profunda TaxID=1286698 RepID=UPI001CA6B514|nr:hypothetical protein [Crassaminicella profunda]QZY56062.1 hypothetical protein K7H06_03415 [Crassaminicella profunda]